MASHPALGMSVSVRGAGPDRAAGAPAVPSLPLEPAGRAIIASVRRPVTVAVAACRPAQAASPCSWPARRSWRRAVGIARLAGNRPRALVRTCHVLAHYPPSGRSCRLRGDGGRADEPIRPKRLPLVTASNRSLEIPRCSPQAGRVLDESAAARVRHWLAWPGSRPSPAGPAPASPTASGGRSTASSATPFATSPTTPGTPARGQRPSTTRPAPAARTTRTPSASPPAPGSMSSGAAGKTASPTTPPSTTPCRTSWPGSRLAGPRAPGAT